MRDYKFYGVGMDPRHAQHVVVLSRRLLRRLLRPIFYRQAQLFEELGSEIDELRARLAAIDKEVRSLPTIESDHVAFGRRLAAIEDKLNGAAEKVSASRNHE
ncbi:MAG: hypothetical protein M3Z84_00190 [Actinomycetota bacterium]|nr:hypothetical protein [Actinomycetota bacterium]